MSSVKIKKIKVFFAAPIMPDSEKSRFPKCHTGERAAFAACAFYAPIYSLQFISFQFISFLFYSAWRKKRNVTNDNENNENYEILRKLRNITKITKITKKRKYFKKNHVIVTFYAKTVYFFIHLKNKTIAFPFFSSVSFFSLRFVFSRYVSLFVNYDFFTK